MDTQGRSCDILNETALSAARVSGAGADLYDGLSATGASRDYMQTHKWTVSV